MMRRPFILGTVESFYFMPISFFVSIFTTAGGLEMFFIVLYYYLYFWYQSNARVIKLGNFDVLLHLGII